MQSGKTDKLNIKISFFRQFFNNLVLCFFHVYRKKTKQIFNAQFGSLFRTHLNSTFFSKRLFRFADIYTSSVTNLMKYSTRHTFLYCAMNTDFGLISWKFEGLNFFYNFGV